MRRGTRRGAASAAVGLMLVASAVWGGPAAGAVSSVAAAAEGPQAVRIPGGPSSATDPAPVSLDADVYLPQQVPAPAVVLAHGFGGSKESVAEEAAELADQGFVVLAYSARGFGESTGAISMNAPDFEVADASAVLDYLAGRPEVTQDGAGDPRVGIAGGSYGGALALLAAGYDDRVDAVASDITWNDLESALFGQSVMAPEPAAAALGAYKQMWSGLFFSAGLVSPDGSVTACGRFAPQWCAAYTEAATQGTVSAEGRALMRASSPASVADQITAPTLLGGGQSDSLFPLDQVNANAQAIAEAHPEVPVKVVWHAAGHDGGVNETERLRALTAAWMSAHLAGGPAVSTDFEVSLVEASAISDRDGGTVEVLTASDYPGLFGDSTQEVQVAGPPQQVLAPAGGVPAAITSLPGLGGLAGTVSQLAGRPLPNQAAVFASEPLAEPVRIVGAPRIRLAFSAATPARDVTLFASVRSIAPGGRQGLPNGLVAPIRLDEVGPDPVEVEIQLPAVVTDVAAGDRLAVVVGTTDQAYRLPSGPAVYSVALVDGQLALPAVALVATGGGAPAWLWPLLALVVAALAWVVVRILRPRWPGAQRRAELESTPLHIEGLVKQFDSVHAVDGVGFTVPRGVVLGLLGPNGAGKTTTMRMVMGLIRPSAGDVYVFGDRVHAGSPVLARIGAFVEGPGFLPHLSGRQNLELFWRASGRTGQDPRFEEVLAIAGLGSAIDRRVRTYSQGMRQRLGIAQAMLGMPDLLLLDEPTNGLDPPQIREMRQVVQDYARDGRTVIISSHLLAEVEQTCSHVVVMSRGRVIAEGTVAELLAGRSGQRLEDVFMDLVGEGHEVVTS